MNKSYLGCILFLLLATSCANTESERKQPEKKVSSVKPASSYRDTLVVSGKAAVFFEPDSIQLEKIKAVTDSNVFRGSMHEYNYQMRNAHLFLNEHWPDVKIIDTKTHRFLRFEAINKEVFLIDLDKADPCGLFLFDGRQAPRPIDMTNIETQVPEYFASKS